MDEACPKCGEDDGIAGKCAAMFVAKNAEIASLRAELTANNELYSISQSDLAAVSLQYDAATAVIERLDAEIARLGERISELYRAQKNTILSAKSVEYDIDALRAAARQDAEALDRYRYAIAFAGADSWDGGPDMRQRLGWARASDPGGNLTNDRVAEIGQTFPTHMRAIPRQDAEEKARLRSIATAAVDYLNAIDKRCRSDDFDFKLKFDAGLVPISEYTTRLRAALACAPTEVRVQAHGPFPGAPFSPKVERS